MPVGIDHSKKFLVDLGVLGVTVVGIVKHHSVLEVIKLIPAIKQLIGDALSVLPELKDLDSGEALELGQSAYEAIKSIVEAAAA